MALSQLRFNQGGTKVGWRRLQFVGRKLDTCLCPSVCLFLALAKLVFFSPNLKAFKKLFLLWPHHLSCITSGIWAPAPFPPLGLSVVQTHPAKPLLKMPGVLGPSWGPRVTYPSTQDPTIQISKFIQIRSHVRHVLGWMTPLKLRLWVSTFALSVRSALAFSPRPSAHSPYQVRWS